MIRPSHRQAWLAALAILSMLAVGTGETFPFNTLIAQHLSVSPKNTRHNKQSTKVRRRKDGVRGGIERASSQFHPPKLAERSNLEQPLPDPGLNTELPFLPSEFGDGTKPQFEINNHDGSSNSASIGSASSQEAGGNDLLYPAIPLPEVTGAGGPGEKCASCSDQGSAQSVNEAQNPNDASALSPLDPDYSSCNQCGFGDISEMLPVGGQIDPADPKQDGPRPVPEAPTWLLMLAGAIFLKRLSRSRKAAIRIVG
jgi:hypothetical protein